MPSGVVMQSFRIQLKSSKVGIGLGSGFFIVLNWIFVSEFILRSFCACLVVVFFMNAYSCRKFPDWLQLKQFQRMVSGDLYIRLNRFFVRD